MDYVVLEFSELQDAFHFGDPDGTTEYNGYSVIAYSINRDLASDFIAAIRDMFDRPILLKEVLDEFESWINGYEDGRR